MRRAIVHSIVSCTRARRCLKIADGLKTITLRGVIGASLPVFGFRPIRAPLLRTANDPNEDSFTISPRSRRLVISLNTSSTIAADSAFDMPALLWTASIKSARVTAVLGFRLGSVIAAHGPSLQVRRSASLFRRSDTSHYSMIVEKLTGRRTPPLD
jgi:hypothetical protein